MIQLFFVLTGALQALTATVGLTVLHKTSEPKKLAPAAATTTHRRRWRARDLRMNSNQKGNRCREVNERDIVATGK